MAEQLNKIQIRAEVLTVLARMQTITGVNEAESVLSILEAQEDKKAILDTLMKELIKSTENKSYLICYMLLRLCETEPLETALWDALKSSKVNDISKSVILNLLKDMGHNINYDEITDYFEKPDEVIDAETKNLLNIAVMNPEAQIDFLDFLYSLSIDDQIILIESLSEDYCEDALANILIPIVQHDITSKAAKVALEALGNSHSQLALNALLEICEYADKDLVSSIKKNFSKLKLSGIRENNTVEFYSKILSESRPYEAYTSYPDGHGNQALIFSREREDDSLQIVALVINDKWGILDCFGFNQVSKPDFARIVKRFYGDDDSVYINQTVLKSLLDKAEKTLLKNGEVIPYEYVCWKNLLRDIPTEPVPMELSLSSNFENKSLEKVDLNKIYLSDIAQKWFLDIQCSEDFDDLVTQLNRKYYNEFFNTDLDEAIDENFDKIFNDNEQKRWKNRILISAYLKYLSHESIEAQRLYSLYCDENAQIELFKNIIRKSIYEYYVNLKFNIIEKEKTTNIFLKKNNDEEETDLQMQLDVKTIEKIIDIIEAKWVANA